MKNRLLLFLISSFLLSACSALNSYDLAPGTATGGEHRTEHAYEPSHAGSVATPVNEPRPDETDPNRTGEEMEDPLREKQKRHGNIDTDNLQTVHVEGALLETILSLFKAIEDNDDQARSKLIYHDNFDVFKDSGPYILAVTRLELDESRVSAVTAEYGLNLIADEVKIVKISTKTLSDQLEEAISTGDYIFIRIDQQWQFYRFQ